ncbi:hypothetical protein GMDG_02489 [Pseudogymnoascus destructans 20631-21]|uniref:Uncharacterized protein n=1 Tax=Pseudogymnoascus destructans (strain ATCC MYA-4855 / 20631-21) TaxID=658429 RepID=L8G389_PSED2|nr:hypothetical protein GMDG_02489 [Pseudogymnoascus destructans 20631-21]
MACLCCKLVSKMELRIERALVRAYLFDCLLSDTDDGHPELSGCYQLQSWLLEVVLTGGCHRAGALRRAGGWAIGRLCAVGLRNDTGIRDHSFIVRRTPSRRTTWI